jgi:hypothetical protein
MILSARPAPPPAIDDAKGEKSIVDTLEAMARVKIKKDVAMLDKICHLDPDLQPLFGNKPSRG